MHTTIQLVIQNMADDILRLANQVMQLPDIDLASSDLKEKVESRVGEDSGNYFVDTILSDYVVYLENGRSPRQGKPPPLDELRDWALSKGIDTDNSTLFMISRAIWENAIEGRPMLATLDEEINKLVDEKYYNRLWQTITEEVTKLFIQA